MLKDYKKVFAQDFNIYFSSNAPPFCILIPFYYYKITLTSKAKYSLKHLCFAF